MKRLIAMSIALAFSAAIGAQAPAPSPMTPEEAAAKKAADRKAKQEMVKGTTEAATSQSSTTPTRNPAPPSKKTDKATAEQRSAGLQGANNPGTNQYGPAAGTAATKVDKSAPKAAKPDLTDPTIQKAMQNQKGS
jgi:hypothetical protein